MVVVACSTSHRQIEALGRNSKLPTANGRNPASPDIYIYYTALPEFLTFGTLPALIRYIYIYTYMYIFCCHNSKGFWYMRQGFVYITNSIRTVLKTLKTSSDLLPSHLLCKVDHQRYGCFYELGVHLLGCPYSKSTTPLGSILGPRFFQTPKITLNRCGVVEPDSKE